MPQLPEDRRERLYEHLKSFVTLSNVHMRAAWLNTGDVSVYVRRAAHVVGNKGMVFLDIGNVTVVNKRQGTRSFLLKSAQELCPWNGVCVQNVLSDSLLERLSKTDDRRVRRRASGTVGRSSWGRMNPA